MLRAAPPIAEAGYAGRVPEIPEIQALAERLDALLAGSRLQAIEPLGFSALKTVAPPPESLLGATLRRAGHRGKFLVLDFEGGARIALHLSQAGRPEIEDPPKRSRPRNGVLRLRFEDRPAIFVREYGTERMAAWWMLAPGDDGPLSALGPEPGSKEFEAFFRTGDDRRRIHTILRDQRTVAGIGRGYANDILWHARLSPFASLGSLNKEERERLLEGVDAVLAGALAIERTRTGGLPPKMGEHFIVHGRYGHPCPRCGADLRRVSYESHEVTYCPACQTGGKILADRRLSRLVK